MDLRQLRYFVGIVQAGSIARAADRLHVAHSAISHHLASLESELERQLVTRGSKGITLTEAGRVLYAHAETILRYVENAKQSTRSAVDARSGSVSIGFPFGWQDFLGFRLFTQVRRDYPQILLHIVDGKSAFLREQLINGRLDLAVLFVNQPERGFAVDPLLLEELFYVTAEPDTSPILLAEVARRPLLMPGPECGTRRAAQQAFTERGLVVTPIGQIDALSVFRHVVASGTANAILPWSALCDRGNESKLNCRRISDATLMRPAALCFSEIAQRAPAIDAVAQALKTLIRDLIDSETWQGVSPIEPAPPAGFAEEPTGFAEEMSSLPAPP